MIPVRWWGVLAAPGPRIDEAIYESAFAHAAAGRSPYAEERYYYPPAFAYTGALLQRGLGATLGRWLLRGANLISLVWILWVATAWLPAAGGRRGWWQRALLAGALLLVAPGVHLGVGAGNISFLAGGLLLAALLAHRSRPHAAALALGLSIVLKPMAASVLPVLFVLPWEGDSSHPLLAPPRRTAIVGALLAAAGLFLFPHLDEMLRREMTGLTVGRTVSTYRLLDLLGVELPPVALLAALTVVATLVVGRLGSLSLPQIVAFCLGLVEVTTPALWSHTLVVFFPVLVMAASLACSRTEALFVALAIAVVLFSQGGGFDHYPAWFQVLFLVVPTATPLLLAAYVVVALRVSPARPAQ